MIESFTLLLLCQLAGETLARALAVPIPGPVIGMALLVTVIAVRGDIPQSLGRAADGILRNLSLMFVPAGVGIVQHLDVLTHHGVRLLLVLVLSTIVALAVTGLVFQSLARRCIADTERGDGG